MTDNAPKHPLLLTRPLASSQRFWSQLPEVLTAQLKPIWSPLIEISALPCDFILRDYQNVVFTSTNGVANAPMGEGRFAFCVGQATTEAADAKGWKAKLCGACADELVANLIDARPATPILHISGKHTRGQVARRLSDAGLDTRNVAVYDQIAQRLTASAKEALAVKKPVIIPLFSPRTAVQLAKQVSKATSAHIVALSPSVAAEVSALGAASVCVASQPSAAAMRKGIESSLAKLRLA